MDDFDRTIHRQQTVGFTRQKMRDRRHRVRSGERVTDRGAVTSVAAQESGVRAVQGGHHARGLAGREHRAGKDRRRCVWDGVMDMEDF